MLPKKMKPNKVGRVRMSPPAPIKEFGEKMTKEEEQLAMLESVRVYDKQREGY